MRSKNLQTVEEIKAEIARLEAKLALLKKPKMKRVQNLMCGTWIEIEEGTPRSCDPSSELYWTM